MDPLEEPARAEISIICGWICADTGNAEIEATGAVAVAADEWVAGTDGLIIAVGAAWANGRMLAVGVDCGWNFCVDWLGVAWGRTVAVSGATAEIKFNLYFRSNKIYIQTKNTK